MASWLNGTPWSLMLVYSAISKVHVHVHDPHCYLACNSKQLFIQVWPCDTTVRACLSLQARDPASAPSGVYSCSASPLTVVYALGTSWPGYHTVVVVRRRLR